MLEIDKSDFIAIRGAISTRGAVTIMINGATLCLWNNLPCNPYN